MADEEVGLPKTTIGKLARDAAAPVLAGTSARVSGDAIDATLACADEFVRLVYAEALEASDAAKKSTVLPDHVVAAITNLGFDDSILQIVKDAAAAAKAEAQASREAAAASRAGGGGPGGFGGAQMTEEEAIAMQQRLFAEARARASSSMMASAAGQEAAAAAAAAVPPGEEEKKE